MPACGKIAGLPAVIRNAVNRMKGFGQRTKEDNRLNVGFFAFSSIRVICVLRGQKPGPAFKAVRLARNQKRRNKR